MDTTDSESRMLQLGFASSHWGYVF